MLLPWTCFCLRGLYSALSAHGPDFYNERSASVTFLAFPPVFFLFPGRLYPPTASRFSTSLEPVMCLAVFS